MEEIMEDIEVITLEDNIDYNVIDRKEINGFTYLLLANVNDDTDVCIRKELKKNDKEYIAMLSGDEELELVIKEFAKDVKE